MEPAGEVRDDRFIMLRVVQKLRRTRRDDEGLVRVCADGELLDGEIRPVEGLPVVLCRAGGRVYALGLRCPHSGALLSKGTIVDGCLECPLHGGRFALDGGAARAGPPRRGVPAYDVVVRDGFICISRLPRRRNRPAHRPWGARR
jgi:3-phenylpropionate/trans-cinnamate dioxygenase ferredoxin component